MLKIQRLGSFILSILSAIQTLQGTGIALSGAFTLILVFWDGGLNFVQQPYVYVPALAFLFSLWTYIGLTVLVRQSKPQAVSVVPQYAYSLVSEGIELSFGKFPANHATHANVRGLAIACNIRNMGVGPIKLHVQTVNVKINGHSTVDDDPNPIVMMFAPKAAKGIRCGLIERPNSNTLSGTATFEFLYGPPDADDYIRKYTLKTKIDIQITKDEDDTVTAGASHSIIDEKDEPYVTR